jgi:transcriptional regulator with XRE-family HTH domain
MGHGTLLKHFRERRGLSQIQLAKAVGVRQATISDLETGKSGRIELRLLDRLAEELRVRASDLVEPSAAILDWLQEQFEGSEVLSGYLFTRDVFLFRIHAGRIPLELEVSKEALEDYSTAIIVADMEEQGLRAQLLKSPGIRLFYRRDRKLYKTDRHSRTRK